MLQLFILLFLHNDLIRYPPVYAAKHHNSWHQAKHHTRDQNKQDTLYMNGRHRESSRYFRVDATEISRKLTRPPFPLPPLPATTTEDTPGEPDYPELPHYPTTLEPGVTHSLLPYTGPRPSFTFPPHITSSLPTEPDYATESESTTPATIGYEEQTHRTLPPFAKIWKEQVLKYMTSTTTTTTTEYSPPTTSEELGYTPRTTEQFPQFGTVHDKLHKFLVDKTKLRHIARQGRTTLDPVMSSVRDKILDDYREYLATINTDELTELNKTIEDFEHEANIPVAAVTDERGDNAMIQQDALIKELNTNLDANKEIVRVLKESKMLEAIDVTIEPDIAVTSDKVERTTEQRKDVEGRVIIEDSLIDNYKEGNVSTEKREETVTAVTANTDDDSETIEMNADINARLDKIADILRMERQYMNNKDKASRQSELRTTKSEFGKIEFDFKVTETHNKVKKQPITEREVYTTEPKRVHADKYREKATNVRKVEHTTHGTNEYDEVVDTSTVITPVQVNIQRTTQTTTTTLPYFRMIEDLNEGYMVVFLLELMRILSSKDKDDVFQVLIHTEQVVLRLHEAGKIIWLGQPLLDITKKLAKLLTESETGVIQKLASKLNKKIRRRHQELSSEVNIIIDSADMLYDDDEGRKLFAALKQFDDYPNTRQSGYAVCVSLIENFLSPYRRLSNIELRQQLLDSINFELRARIPGANLREGDALTSEGPKEATEETTSSSVESDSDTSVSYSRKKQKKLQKLNSKRKQLTIQPDYINENVFRRHYSYTHETQYQYPLLRNMKPITNIQRRYKIVKPAYRHNMVRHWSTQSYIVNLISRPTKEYTTELNKAKNPSNARFPFFYEPIRFRNIGATADSGIENSAITDSRYNSYSR